MRRRAVRRRDGGFNPLPSPKRGEISSFSASLSAWKQFQSAPLTEARGDSCRRGASGRRSRFQSAPLTEARGDADGFAVIPTRQVFQSAPLTEARGDSGADLQGASFEVSIRSPHRSEGRSQEEVDQARRCLEFQSAPLTEARGDPCAIRPRPKQPYSFQSAPLTEARGDPIEQVLRIVVGGFNPLPSPKRGEMRPRQALGRLRRVSIRSPHRSEGRLRDDSNNKREATCFNPLPSPKRGEICKGPTSIDATLRGRFNPLPLPSPKRGEIEAGKVGGCGNLPFQSAPLTEARGD